MIKKNDIVDVQISNLGINGEGVAKYDDTVLFVPFALPKEIVTVQVINTKQKAYICKVLDVKSPDPDRVEPKCPYYKKCGGCQLQHLKYLSALSFKTELVQNAITHIGKIDFKVDECVPSDSEYRYRNKFAFPVDPVSRKAGMFRTASHSIIPIEDCVIQEDWAKDVIQIFNEYLSETNVSIYNENSQSGLIRHIVARLVNDELLLTVVVNGDSLPFSDVLVAKLGRAFKVFGLNININKSNTNVIMSNNFVNIYGINDINIQEFDINYTINNASFMQVNSSVKNKIYSKVLDEISEKDVVIDAYSGAGLLTAIMSKKCKWAYGIEIVKPATDAADNLKLQNNIENMTNICGDTSKELPRFKSLPNLVVVLDPPRKGCDKKVIDTLCVLKPQKIIYISCNPSTLARDLNNLLTENHYKIKSITPFDMFPQTKHVETLAILEKI